MIKLTTLLAGMWMLSGCAGLQQAYQDQVCNGNAGYERGMNDARSGHPMDSSFALNCEGPTRAAAEQGYRSGYGAGLAANQAETPQTEVNVNLGGPPNTGGPQNVGSGPAERMYCEAHAFTDTFSAWGESEPEARDKVRHRCMDHYQKMFCEDIHCHPASAHHGGNTGSGP